MNEAKFRWIIVAAVALLGVVAYANTMDGGWVWDDVSSVLLHRHVQDPAKFFQLFREDQHPFGQGQGNFYRPLLAASFMADFLLTHGPHPAIEEGWQRPEISTTIFHASNIAWHVLAALLFFALLTRLDAPRFVRAAAPLLFVVHPLHTEAVAYISGRADMMMAAFLFGGLTLAVADPDAPRRVLRWLGVGLCCVAALLSKEAGMIFPVLLLAIMLFLPAGGQTRKAALLGRAVPLAIAGVFTGVYLLLRATVLKFAESSGGGAPFGDRVVETLQSFAYYIKLLFAPANLHMERTLDGVPGYAVFVGALLLLLCVAGIVAAIRAKQHRIAMGLGWFLIAWLPISGLFPLNAPMAEHWMYVPMAGFWWAVLETLLLLTWRMPVTARAVPVYALALVFLAVTVARNQDWTDNASIYSATLADNPESRRVQHNLAVTFESLTGNAPGARRHFEDFLELEGAVEPFREVRGDHIEVHLSLAGLYYQQERYDKAMARFGLLAQGLAGQEGYEQAQALAALGLGRTLIAYGQIQPALEVLNQLSGTFPPLAPQAQALIAGAP